MEAHMDAFYFDVSEAFIGLLQNMRGLQYSALFPTGCVDLFDSGICLVSSGSTCEYSHLYGVPRKSLLFAQRYTFEVSSCFFPTLIDWLPIWLVVAVA